MSPIFRNSTLSYLYTTCGDAALLAECYRFAALEEKILKMAIQEADMEPIPRMGNILRAFFWNGLDHWLSSSKRPHFWANFTWTSLYHPWPFKNAQAFCFGPAVFVISDISTIPLWNMDLYCFLCHPVLGWLMIAHQFGKIGFGVSKRRQSYGYADQWTAEVLHSTTNVRTK